MMRTILAAAVLAGCLGLAMPAAAQPKIAAAYPPNDYADQANWLCWPGRDDACASDLTTTVVHADGTTAIEKFQADPNAPIDCFYVYPTVSRDPDVFSTMAIGPVERNVVIQQAARLRASCRLYAPMYRQFTLTALMWFTQHPPPPGAPRPRGEGPAFRDVKDAWAYYLAHENHGRGVVLVGHSQGSGVLGQLIATEIDGKPEQARLVSAILMGASLNVPVGKDVGGDFKSIPLCHSSTQLGCAIAYSSFRETSPPPPNSRFGLPHGPPQGGPPGMEAACVNPANLAGDWGEAKAYFGSLIVLPGTPKFDWLKDRPIETPFVAAPGLITAECVHTGPYHYLAIRLHPKDGPRARDIPGDVVIGGAVLNDWGLHLIDANLFMGNLVDIVHDEGEAWLRRGSAAPPPP